MKRMSVSLVDVLLVVSVGLLLPKPVNAKCTRSLIIVKGEVQGEIPHGASVELRISPNPNHKMSPVSVTNGKFEVEAFFDTFKSLSWLGRHNCSRRPEAVIVVLIAEGKELQTVRLAVARDFEETKEGHFVLRSELTIVVKPRSGNGPAGAPKQLQKPKDKLSLVFLSGS